MRTDIRLRPLKKEDAPAICEWMNDEDSTRYLGSGFGKKRTLDDVLSYVDDRLSGDFTGDTYAIADAETDEYLGQCDLMLPDPRAKKAEIAIVLRTSARGKGIGEAALRTLLALAFGQGYNRLYLKCCAENLPALRLYEKIGFQKEGLLRQDMAVDGRLADTALYGILKSDIDNEPRP